MLWNNYRICNNLLAVRAILKFINIIITGIIATVTAVASSKFLTNDGDSSTDCSEVLDNPSF